jgi:hypothetical protein
MEENVFLPLHQTQTSKLNNGIQVENYMRQSQSLLFEFLRRDSRNQLLYLFVKLCGTEICPCLITGEQLNHRFVFPKSRVAKQADRAWLSGLHIVVCLQWYLWEWGLAKMWFKLLDPDVKSSSTRLAEVGSHKRVCRNCLFFKHRSVKSPQQRT